MDVRSIRNLQAAVNTAIEQRRLKEAFSLILPLLRELHDGDLLDEQYNLEFTYKSMLKYATSGVDDPQRADIHNRVLLGLYALSDGATEKLLSKYSGEVAYDVKRELQEMPSSALQAETTLFLNLLADMQLRASVPGGIGYPYEYEQSVTRLFQLVWLSDRWSLDQIAVLEAFIVHVDVPWYVKSLLSSAMLLSLLRSWNYPLLLVMLGLTAHPDYRVKMRSIVNMVLVFFKYDSRLPLYPELGARLKLMQEDNLLAQQVQAVMIQLIRTRETERISDKLQNEILPEVMKIQSVIRHKFDVDNMVSDSGDDKNPEWSELFADSPQLLGKLEEISKWQMEGADVFLNTFQMLKHFPFFNQLNNWLMPFYIDHPAVQLSIAECGDALKGSSLFENVGQSGFLCNSDKYSLFLGIPHMPHMQQQMLGQMFHAEMEQLQEIEKDELAVNPGKRDLSVSNQYVQDLYRFFKIHPQKSQFLDVFAWKLDFQTKWFFGQLFADMAPARQMAEYLFVKNYHAEALEIFSMLVPHDAQNVELLQKMAFCYQKLNNKPAALEHFLKADLLRPANLWNLKKIARCYTDLADYTNALDYYLQAAKIDGDSLNIQLSIGHCLLETHQYEEALKYFFRVTYLDPSNSKVWRPIAWCSFVLGKFEQAEKYYQKLLVINQTFDDLVGLAHVNLCSGKTQEALCNYRDGIRKGKGGMVTFLKLMEQEKHLLLQHGVSEADLPIFIDQIMYLLEE
jgi:tetratricopeptide (TPR) repeat protein